MSINVANKSGIYNSKRDIPKYVAVEPVPYVRPADWLTLPTVGATEQKFVGLYAVYDFTQNNVSVNATTSTGTYTVDWGDGTSPQTYTSGVAAEYNYNYATISNSTISSRGYKQVIITITPTTGNLLTVTTNVKSSALPSTLALLSWLDIAIGSPTLNTFNLNTTSQAALNILEQVKVISCATSLRHNFSGLTNLLSVEIPYQVHSITGGPLFDSCTNLRNAPVMQLEGYTNLASMFTGCRNLTYIPEITLQNIGGTSNVNLSSMFNACAALQVVPPITLKTAGSITNTSGMFQGCWSLTVAPFFDTSNVTDTTNMFNNCRELTTVPLYNLQNCLNTSGMFNNCSALASIPKFDISKVTNTSLMFNGCYALQEIPLLDTGNVANAYGMFSNCQSLYTIPQLNTSNVTNMSQFLLGSGIVEIPLLNTSKVTTTEQMFQSCTGLTSVPALDFNNVINMTNTFASCTALSNIGIANVSKVTNMTLTFNGCFSFTGEGLANIDTSNVTALVSTFQACTSLNSIPTFNTSKVTQLGSLFFNCNSLTSIPALNLSNVGAGTLSLSAGGIGRVDVYGEKTSTSVSGQRLGKKEIESFFTNAGIAANTSQVLTITSNPGAAAAITKTGVTVTGGNLTIPIANTVGITTGQSVYGAVTTSGFSATIDATTDTLTFNGHGLPNGTRITFNSITTTTGISIYTYYYVINSTTNTFQIALSPGGAAIDMTNNGSAAVLRPIYVASINPNVSIDTNVPATYSVTSGPGNIIFRDLDVYLATQKRWTITG